MNGETPMAGSKLIDPEQAELAKKQGVNVKGPLIDETINCKICDLGNGCWTHFHFVPKIQTRQYRAPEVILGIDYDASTDLWSYACMVFELITGDFLFNPRPGDDYKKNDDHLALFMELLGPAPKKFAMQGNMFDHYFHVNPHSGKYIFRRITDLKSNNLKRLLIYKYHFKLEEAEMLSDFLLKILKWNPRDRPTAQQMLEHPWLKMADNYSYKMSEMQQQLFELRDQNFQIESLQADFNAITEEKADMLGQNHATRQPMSLEEVELMKRRKQMQRPTVLYRYPGELVDSDDEINAADLDCERNIDCSEDESDW